MERETITTLVTTMIEVAGNVTAPSNIATIKLATKVINIFILTFLMLSMGCTIDLKDLKGTVGIVFSFMCIITAFVLSFILNPTFLNAAWQLWFCAASLPLLGYSLGYGIAFLLRQPHKKCRTIAFETGSQNVSLAMTLTVVTFANSPLFFDMFFYPSLYACFIYIDSFLVISIYKIVVCLMNKNGSHMDNQIDDFDVVDGGEEDDDKEDIENDDEVIREDEKMALKAISVNKTSPVLYMKTDGDKYKKM